MSLRPISVWCVSVALIFGLSACSGGSPEVSPTPTATSAASSETVEQAAKTLEDVFAGDPSIAESVEQGFGMAADAMQGMSFSSDVKGNDFIMTIDLTEAYQKMGITAENIESAMAGTNTYLESMTSQLGAAVQAMEKEYGVEDLRLVYRMVYDSEVINELIVDSEGNVVKN